MHNVMALHAIRYFTSSESEEQTTLPPSLACLISTVSTTTEGLSALRSKNRIG